MRAEVVAQTPLVVQLFAAGGAGERPARAVQPAVRAPPLPAAERLPARPTLQRTAGPVHPHMGVQLKRSGRQSAAR